MCQPKIVTTNQMSWIWLQIIMQELLSVGHITLLNTEEVIESCGYDFTYSSQELQQLLKSFLLIWVEKKRNLVS